MASASLKRAEPGSPAALLVSRDGAALHALEPEDLCALDLRAVRALFACAAEDSLASALRRAQLDPDAPAAALDAPLHAALLAPVVVQTYPSALLALACQPDAEARVRALLGAGVGWISWTASVLEAARAAARACEKHPELEAVLVQGRGLLCFGRDAGEALERVRRIAGRADEVVRERMEGGRLLDARPVVAMRDAGEVAHVLRGALAAPTGELDRPFVHVVLDFRASDEIAHFASAPITPLLAAAMPPSEAHARLAGGSWLFVASPPYADLRKLRDVLRSEVEAYRRAWIASLERCRDGASADEIGPLDPTPRAVLLPGLGLFGVGATRAQAQAAASAAEHAIRVKIRAATLGQYEGLETCGALLAGPPGPMGPHRALAGQVALVAGTGARGAAVSRALLADGAEVLLVEPRAEPGPRDAEPSGIERLEADLADALDARDVLRAAVERLGGIDVLVLDVDALSFDACASLVEQAVAALSIQGTGGAIVLIARDADVTHLCRAAARNGAPANVCANGLRLGAADRGSQPRIPVTDEHVARAVLFLAERGVPLSGVVLPLGSG